MGVPPSAYRVRGGCSAAHDDCASNGANCLQNCAGILLFEILQLGREPAMALLTAIEREGCGRVLGPVWNGKAGDFSSCDDTLSADGIRRRTIGDEQAGTMLFAMSQSGVTRYS